MKKDYLLTEAKILILDIFYPYQEMLAEAVNLSNRFIPYRSSESQGWESLTLYGLGEDKTSNFFEYGYTIEDEAAKNYHWTNAAYESPITMNFLKNIFPSQLLSRTRFMKLKAGGFIGPHSDGDRPVIENVNLVLNNPKECIWKWGDGTEVLMVPGVTYAMNTHYTHSITNNSYEDRYHLIVQHLDSIPEWKSILNNSLSKGHYEGQYFTHDTLS